MDAGPRGLGCQTAWVSFQAMGGYFFDSPGLLVKRRRRYNEGNAGRLLYMESAALMAAEAVVCEIHGADAR
jgi:hypothetical protein